ncbi:hypothetical protein E4T56_gene5582, partial [Termitomyces sp. T112]
TLAILEALLKWEDKLLESVTVSTMVERGTVAQLAPLCPKAGHMICECKVGVSTLAECACVENTLDTTWVISTPPGSLRPHVLD